MEYGRCMTYKEIFEKQKMAQVRAYDKRFPLINRIQTMLYTENYLSIFCKPKKIYLLK